MRAYSPAQVFAVLECGGDFSITYKQLLDMGYGEPPRGSWVSNNTFNSEKWIVSCKQLAVSVKQRIVNTKSKPNIINF